MGKNYLSVSESIWDRNLYVFEKCIARQDGCWLWNRYINEDGYGKFGWMWEFDKITKESAHIISWVISHRNNVPFGMEVCHSCDNPQCVKPEHLFVATHADNVKDMAAKGRHWDSRGERNPAAKLTEKDVLYVKQSNASDKELSKKLGVSRCAIRDIRAGRTWAWVS